MYLVIFAVVFLFEWDTGNIKTQQDSCAINSCPAAASSNLAEEF